MSNKTLGNHFENFFCQKLFSNGFWVHNLVQNQSGQPADVIASRNGVAYLIDCKVCSGHGFPLSRIEENQDTSMTLWGETGNGVGWFALLYENEIYMIDHKMMQFYRRHTSVLTEAIITANTKFNEWVKKCK